MDKVYVAMTDKFLSGWGYARGTTAKYVIECDTIEDAWRIERNAKKREEMRHVNICLNNPVRRYERQGYQVTLKKYKDLGQIWKR